MKTLVVTVVAMLLAVQVGNHLAANMQQQQQKKQNEIERILGH